MCHVSVIPANSPSLGRSLRHFRLAKISVRGDGNLRHLSIGIFFSGHHFVFSSYNPDEWIMQKTAMASRQSGSPPTHHVQEMQEKRKRTRPTLALIG